MSLSYEVLPVGSLQCNCVILYDNKEKSGIIFDPGEESSMILDKIKELSLKIKAIIHTHAHFDHVMASEVVLQNSGANIPVYLHPEDNFLWEKLNTQAESFGINASANLPEITAWLEDGKTIKLGSQEIKVIHTPGHSPGSCCFFIENDNNPILISGDTVFYGSIGRTDLWGGDMTQILNSIQSKILTLPDSTKIIPGHGPSTQVGEEKKHNPFFTG